MYFATNKSEWLTFLPCTFSTEKCGSKTQLLNLTTNVTTISMLNLDQGDVCMYEFNYNGTNNDFKFWVATQTNVMFTLVDGIREHPWLNRSVLNDSFIVKKMTTEDDPHEFGDSWYS